MHSHYQSSIFHIIIFHNIVYKVCLSLHNHLTKCHIVVKKKMNTISAKVLNTMEWGHLGFHGTRCLTYQNSGRWMPCPVPINFLTHPIPKLRTVRHSSVPLEFKTLISALTCDENNGKPRCKIKYG